MTHKNKGVLWFVLGVIMLSLTAYSAFAVRLQQINTVQFSQLTNQQIAQVLSDTWRLQDISILSNSIDFDISLYSVQLEETETELRIYLTNETRTANLPLLYVDYCFNYTNNNIVTCQQVLLLGTQPFDVVINNQTHTVEPVMYQIYDKLIREYSRVLRIRDYARDWLANAEYRQRINELITIDLS